MTGEWRRQAPGGRRAAHAALLAPRWRRGSFARHVHPDDARAVSEVRRWTEETGAGRGAATTGKRSEDVSTNTAGAPDRPRLSVPRRTARGLLRKPVKLGEALLERRPRSDQGVLSLCEAAEEWSTDNVWVLREIEHGGRLAEEYRAEHEKELFLDDESFRSLYDARGLIEECPKTLDRISRLVLRLPEPDPEQDPDADSERARSRPQGRTRSQPRVFVVHGHDLHAKEAVVRLLHELRLEPIVLGEELDHGRTVIEKFETRALAVEFAVVVLTADDVGASAGTADAAAKAAKGAPTGELRKRARQNVVFELGYFIRQLGRDKVLCLHSPEVEVPSDLAGVLCIPFDKRSDLWRYELARALRGAGAPVSLDDVGRVAQ